jgi:type II secretory pathway pseudopilin PulG
MSFPRRSKRREEHGYILITLLLFVALMAIAATAVAPMITFEVKRDREEELIHRGVQYSRAVRRFYKKFGRFPVRIEDLENSNNIRFLRKRYKDPITGQDFKLLHYGDVQMTLGAGLAAAGPAGLAALGGAGMQQGAMGAAAAALGGAGMQQNVMAAAAVATMAASQPTANLNPGQTPTDSSASPTGPGGASAGGSGSSSANPSAAGSSGSPFGSPGQVFGGGPLVGVASTSKKETIREFNKKKRYDQWQFIYDPGTDRGGLLNAPGQPPLQGVTMQGPTVPQSGFGGMQGTQGGMQGIQSQPGSQPATPGQGQQGPPQ